jgi:cytochrome c
MRADATFLSHWPGRKPGLPESGFRGQADKAAGTGKTMRIGVLVVLGVLGFSACGEASQETAAASPETVAAIASTPELTLADLPEPYNQADLENGKVEFAKCKNCHSIIASDGNLVGPNLHGVFERPPASAAKFRYSEALKNATIEKWTPEELDQWLEDPKAYLPGSSMFFDGIANPDSRRDVIAYLATES